MANFITFLRVLLAITSLSLLQETPFTNLIGIVLILFSMLMDMLDGVIARFLKTVSFEGSIYDILGDRIIENLFFIYYASLSFFSIWVAIVILLRGLTIDAIRTVYAAQGKTAFGKTTWHTRNWIQLLICSNISRGTYNAFKCSMFMAFAVLIQPNNIIFLWISKSTVEQIAYFSLWVTVTLALIRCGPILIDAWLLRRQIS